MNPVDALADPDSELVQEALTRRCDLCNAGKGDLCTNTINAGKPLPGRVVHFARLVDRRRK